VIRLGFRNEFRCEGPVAQAVGVKRGEEWMVEDAAGGALLYTDTPYGRMGREIEKERNGESE
jgi:hypothetical protein